MEHVSAGSIEEACTLLEKHTDGAKVLGGGTDLLVACKLRNVEPALLIGLEQVPELTGIEFREGEGMRIGAMTRLYEIRLHDAISNYYRALSQAAAAVGTVQLQHMGTIGGNICLNTRCFYYNQSHSWRKTRAVCFKMGGEICHVVPKGKKCFAVFTADTVPVLIALGAQVKLKGSSSERIIDIRELYSGDGREPIKIGPGEILTEIMIPPPSERQGSTYLKYRLRGAIDFPLVGVAARMDSSRKGVCTECKVVLTGVASGPVEVGEANDLLKGKRPDEKLINEAARIAAKAARPVENVFGATPAYRRKMASFLTRRALIALVNELGLKVRNKSLMAK
jgi:4-hydroxybenzoyl-CoA reductase subunit beta